MKKYMVNKEGMRKEKESEKMKLVIMVLMMMKKILGEMYEKVGSKKMMMGFGGIQIMKKIKIMKVIGQVKRYKWEFIYIVIEIEVVRM